MAPTAAAPAVNANVAARGLGRRGRERVRASSQSDSLEARVAVLEVRGDADLGSLETRLIRWFVGCVLVQATLMVGLVAFSENRLSGLNAQMLRLEVRQDNLVDRVSDMRVTTELGFAALNTRVDALDAKVDALGTRVESSLEELKALLLEQRR